MTQTALIFGDGSTAALAAEELTSAGLQVQISTPEETLDGNLPMEGAKLLPQTTPRFCRCTERGYLIGLNGSDTTREVRAEHVAVAMESVRVPLFKGYGLEPSPRVLSLSQAAAGTPDITTSGKGAPPTVLFLIGLFQETHPVITEQALRCALAFQDEAGFRCVVMTGNLKVAADGLEALYRDCRSHGIWFVKRTSPLGDIQQDESGVVHVTYRDEVTREAFALRADLTVVDEGIVPSPALSRLAEVLELEKDSDGFVQADNVHRLPVYTNRKNIWIIGPSRAILGPEAVRMDVVWLAREAGWKAEKQQPPPEDRAQIDTGLCVRCLTCHRLCPYRAVTIGSRMTVDPHRCERCGICAAECPALAIRIPGVEPALLPSRPKDRPGAGEGMPSPEILAFGCARSAVPARQMALDMGRTLPKGLRVLEVPCAGSVSVHHVLSALLAGADGVMLLHCHPDNCHSGSGNRLALQRMKRIQDMAAAVGMEPDRIMAIGLASNMGAIFSDRANRFEAFLRELGPLGKK